MKVRSLTSCQKSLGLAVLLFSMNFAAVRAERVAALHPDVLRGVSEVRVLVEDPGGDYAPRLQLTRQQVQRAIIDQLTARGIKASPSKEGDRAGFLYVGLIFTSVNNALGKTIGVAFMVETKFREDVIPVRNKELVLYGSGTWWQPPLLGVTAPANAESMVLEVVRAEVDDFIKDYLTANPKK